MEWCCILYLPNPLRVITYWKTLWRAVVAWTPGGKITINSGSSNDRERDRSHGCHAVKAAVSPSLKPQWLPPTKCHSWLHKHGAKSLRISPFLFLSSFCSELCKSPGGFTRDHQRLENRIKAFWFIHVYKRVSQSGQGSSRHLGKPPEMSPRLPRSIHPLS